MKKSISLFVCFVLLFSALALEPIAANEGSDSFAAEAYSAADTRATGLILKYGLTITSESNKITIYGITDGALDVVKCGIKNLTVERRLNNNDSWESYYEFDNLYADSDYIEIRKVVAVTRGYQYRVTCKHYAKKNILMVENISNTSNIIAL